MLSHICWRNLVQVQGRVPRIPLFSCSLVLVVYSLVFLSHNVTKVLRSQEVNFGSKSWFGKSVAFRTYLACGSAGGLVVRILCRRCSVTHVVFHPSQPDVQETTDCCHCNPERLHLQMFFSAGCAADAASPVSVSSDVFSRMI